MDIYTILAGLVVGAKSVQFEVELALQVKGADKDGGGYRRCEKDGRVFVALNATTKLGHRFDLEISDPSGFSPEWPLFDPDNGGAAVDYQPPKPGQWVSVLRPRLSSYIYNRPDGTPERKFKARIDSVFQLRVIGDHGRISPAVNAARPSRRARAKAV